MLRSFSHARHFTSTTTVVRIHFSREYRDLLSYVTFLLLQCQLRETSVEINPLIQFYSYCMCEARCMKFAFSCMCWDCRVSETLSHSITSPQALSLDQAKREKLLNSFLFFLAQLLSVDGKHVLLQLFGFVMAARCCMVWISWSMS